MALILIAMFMVASFSSTTPNDDKKKPSRSGQATKQSNNNNINKPALHEFDMDQVGWVRPNDDDSSASSSSASSDDNKKKPAAAATANDNTQSDIKKSGDQPSSASSVSSSSSGDSMDYYDMDLEEFYRDADLLDAQAAVDEAADEFFSNMQDELVAKQKEIDDALKEKMTEIETDAKAINDKQPQPSKFNDGDFKKLMDNIRNDLRNAVNEEIEEMAMEMLDDINIDMEAAVDINEEYEQEGSGDPIDLEQEQEELTLQVIQLTGEIIEEVLEMDLPELAFSTFQAKVEQALKDKFKNKQFQVDVNRKELKVTGWKDVTPPPPPTPAPTNPPTEAPKKEEEKAANEPNGEEDAAAAAGENKVEEEKEKEEADVAEGQ